MPPILIAFFILIGATTGPPAIKGLVSGKDPIARPKWGKPAPQEYRTWTSVPWVASPNKETRQCEVTYFAMATRNKITRLRAGDQEQLLDSSWTFTRQIPNGERRTIAFSFLDPVGGDELACREESVQCGNFTGLEKAEGRCAKDAGAKSNKRRQGKPRLVAQVYPVMTLYNPAIGGAPVTLTFEVQGELTEEWYCPAIDVEWIDGTRSKAEGDCDPFPGDPEQIDRQHRWKFDRVFPPSPENGWPVTACVHKSGGNIACETARVRVMGGGGEASNGR